MEQAIYPREAMSSAGYGSSTGGHNEAHSSGVSWSAVIAGGFVTAALSLILLALGTGLGLSSFSVWTYTSSTASKLGAAAIVWMIFTHFASAAMGGYLAGRLRTKWANIHTDEVYFRDTAHGFLSWSLAVVVTAAFLASAAASMIGSSANESGGKGCRSDLNPGKPAAPRRICISSICCSVPQTRGQIPHQFLIEMKQRSFSQLRSNKAHSLQTTRPMSLNWSRHERE